MLPQKVAANDTLISVTVSHGELTSKQYSPTEFSTNTSGLSKSSSLRIIPSERDAATLSTSVGISS